MDLKYLFCLWRSKATENLPSTLQEKESSKDLLEASRYSENLATELVAISAASSSPGLILRAVDNRNVVLLDSLIEHEQKEASHRPKH